MATIGLICSNTMDLSLTTAQNVWTTRVLPLNNVVITGVVMRDTTGLTLSGPVGVYVVPQGAASTFFFGVEPITPSGPRYSNALASNASQAATLTTNPTVMATVTYGWTSTSQLVTIDLLGYFI